MASTYAGVEFITEYALARAANSIRGWLMKIGRKFNYVCGGIFVMIGTALPLRN